MTDRRLRRPDSRAELGPCSPAQVVKVRGSEAPAQRTYVWRAYSAHPPAALWAPDFSLPTHLAAAPSKLLPLGRIFFFLERFLIRHGVRGAESESVLIPCGELVTRGINPEAAKEGALNLSPS